MTHDYKRHGTTTHFAALNVLDGTVIGRNMQCHRHQEFARLLNAVEAEIRIGKAVHVSQPSQLAIDGSNRPRCPISTSGFFNKIGPERTFETSLVSKVDPAHPLNGVANSPCIVGGMSSVVYFPRRSPRLPCPLTASTANHKSLPRFDWLPPRVFGPTRKIKDQPVFIT